MIDKLLMSRPFRRYIESWAVVLMPWLLFTEREAVTIDGVFPTPPAPGPGESYDELRKEVDMKDDPYPHCGCLGPPLQPCGPYCSYSYTDFSLLPEEEQEMEDRRDFDLKGDERGEYGADCVCWNEDDWRKSPTEEEDDDWLPYVDDCGINCNCQNPRA